MQSSIKGFALGLGVSIIVIVSFLAGGLADRFFVLKPVSLLSGLQKTPLIEQSTSQISDAPTVLKTEERSVVDVAEQASSSVVTIAIVNPPVPRISLFSDRLRRSLEEEAEKSRDIGTGFVATSDGLIVTNKHVVDIDAEYLVIDRDEKEHKVTKIYRDPFNDLAILQVEGMSAAPLVLGNSDELKVGQQVIAIGTALGRFRHTVTTGVVSGLARGIEAGSPLDPTLETLENVIQTDAAINPGNSGGPLLDSAGKVIGVNVAISAAGENIGFAIPINVVRGSIENFNNTGQFERPLLGVRYRMIPEVISEEEGVPVGAYVFEVNQGSAASEAGVLPMDIITEFDGKNLAELDLSQAMGSKKVGDRVRFKIWRNGETQNLETTLRRAE